MTLTRKSPCKVNLVLNILGRRADGFHELETLFLPVPLFDGLTLSYRSEGFLLTCSHASLPTDSTNLVHRAAMAFFDKTGMRPEVHIHLEKNLPLAAGLGAGSANAAVTLRLLNDHFGAPLDGSTLDGLAAALGSDVNFFLQDQPALATGRGEQIRPVGEFPIFNGRGMLLYHPGFGVPTPWAFRELADFPAARDGQAGRAAETAKAFRNGPWEVATGLLYNALEKPVFRKYPILQIYQEFLLGQGARAALMCGSGSTTFALFDTLNAARASVSPFLEQFGTTGWLQVVGF